MAPVCGTGVSVEAARNTLVAVIAHILSLVWRRNKGRRAEEGWNHLSSLIHTNVGTTSRSVHSGRRCPSDALRAFLPLRILRPGKLAKCTYFRSRKKGQMPISEDQ